MHSMCILHNAISIHTGILTNRTCAITKRKKSIMSGVKIYMKPQGLNVEYCLFKELVPTIIKIIGRTLSSNRYCFQVKTMAIF